MIDSDHTRRIAEALEKLVEIGEKISFSLNGIDCVLDKIEDRVQWLERFTASSTGPVKNYFFHSRAALERTMDRFHEPPEERFREPPTEYED